MRVFAMYEDVKVMAWPMNDDTKGIWKIGSVVQIDYDDKGTPIKYTVELFDHNYPVNARIEIVDDPRIMSI